MHYAVTAGTVEIVARLRRAEGFSVQVFVSQTFVARRESDGCPRVSVIIPTKDRGPLLRQAVESVLSQAFDDFEIIIVDDASVDGSSRHLAEFHPRIRYLRHERSMGPCAARNTGIRAARGKYIAFLDDDDVWLPDKLGRQVQVIEGAPDDVGVVYTGIRWRDVNGRVWDAGALASGNIYEALFGSMEGLPVNNVTMMVRRECFEDVGTFDEDLLYGEAWDMHVRLAKRWKFMPIVDPLAIVSRQPASVSADPRLVAAGRRRLVRKFAAELRARPRAESTFYMALGVLEDKLGNTAQARADLIHALAAWPWNWRAIGHLTLTFPPGIVRDAAGALWRKIRSVQTDFQRRRAGIPD